MNTPLSTLAILITCYNRKEITLKCIESLYKAFYSCSKAFDMTIYVTDDGSTDDTSTEIQKLYPSVVLLHGDGNLFWAGGMRNSWNEALRIGYDAYLLINDDTILYPDCFDQLFETHAYSILNHKHQGIYIGSTIDPVTNQFSYGGRLLVNQWTYQTQILEPNGKIQVCDLGNANIMLVPAFIVNAIGIFSSKYIHAKADYDYSLRANEKKIPLLICAHYCGTCPNNAKKPSDMSNLTFRERVNYLKGPLGIELSGYMYFMWRFFPWRAPFVYCSLWLKTVFPRLTGIIDKSMRRK